MFSFHATKVFHTIEGGCVCFRDPDLKDRLFRIKNFGIQENETWGVGGNATMNEFEAAMGVCNLRHLEEQIRKYHPVIAAVADEEKARQLRLRISDLDVKVVSGMEGMIEAVTLPQTDIVVTAVVGMIGIRPTLEAINAGKDIALANKETLVTAGHLVMKAASEKSPLS